MSISKALAAMVSVASIIVGFGIPLPANALASCSCDYCATYPYNLCYAQELQNPTKCPIYSEDYCPSGYFDSNYWTEYWLEHAENPTKSDVGDLLKNQVK